MPVSDVCVCVCVPVYVCPGIDKLLTTLRSLNEKVGTYDEEEEFKMLEQLLQSSRFQKAKSVRIRTYLVSNSLIDWAVTSTFVLAAVGVYGSLSCFCL